VSCIGNLSWDHSRSILPVCRRPRTCTRLHVRVIYFKSESIINARRLSRNYFAVALSVRAHDVGGRSGIGIQQQIAPNLPRLLCEIVRLSVRLLERDHQSRENHGAQNPAATQVVSRFNLLISLIVPAKAGGCSRVCNGGPGNNTDSAPPAIPP
jgi:hypothetical protein